MSILTSSPSTFTPPEDAPFPEVREGEVILYTVLGDTRAEGLSFSIHHTEAHELWTRIETGTEDEEKAAAVFTRIMEARAAGDIEAEEEGYEAMDKLRRDIFDSVSSDEIHIPLPPEHAAGPELAGALEALLKTSALSNPGILTPEDREALGNARAALTSAAPVKERGEGD